MTAPRCITDEDLQDYLDDRLSDRRRGEVAEFLAQNPAKSAEIEALRLQDDSLRSLGAEILEEPVPQRLSAVLHAAKEEAIAAQSRSSGYRVRRSFLFVEIAAALVIFVLGGVVGWAGHDQLRRGPSEIDLILSNATFAFSTFANDEDHFLNFSPEQDDELMTASERIFNRRISRPDLTELGFSYSGARILPGERRLVGYLLFRDEAGGRLSITVWPSALPPNPSIVASQMEDIQARFWLENNLGFAVMGQTDGQILDEVTEQVFSFYRNPEEQ